MNKQINESKVFAEAGTLLKILLINVLLVSGLKVNAQYIGNTNPQICSNQSITVAIVSYCTTCTYKFGPTGGTLSTVSIVPIGGGVGTFATPVIGAGSYTVTQNNVSIGTINVTVTSPPTVTLSTGGQQPIGCSGDQITLTGSGANSYKWKKNGTQISTASQITVNFTAGVTDTYTLEGTVSHCGSTSTQTRTVDVQGKGTLSGVSITGGVPSRCQGGGTTDFNSSGSNVATWSNFTINQGGSINATTGLVTWNSSFSGTATISRTASDDCGNSVTATKTVTVNPNPAKHYMSASKTSLCPSEVSALGLTSSTNGTTYKLYRVGTSSALSTKGGASNGGSISFGNHSTAGQYYVQATNSCGTVEMHNRITLTNKSGNTASIAITRSGNFSTDGSTQQMYACSGTTITLGINATGLNLSSWQWKRNGSNYGSANANSISVTQSGTYTLQLNSYSYDTDNCYSGSISNPSVGITIHSAVGNLSNKTANFTSCQTGRNPGVTAPSGQIVKWYTSGGSPISGTPNFDALGVGTHTYKVKASNNHAIRECISPSFATVTINVNSPTPSVFGTSEYCQSDAPTTDKLYVRDVDPHCSWQLRANNGSTVLDNSLAWDGTAGMHYFNFSPRTSPGSKTVRAYKNGVQFATFTQTINANQTAAIAITRSGNFSTDGGNPNQLYACSGTNITLGINATGLNLSSWQWKRNGSNYGSANANSITLNQSGTYTLNIINYSYDTQNCYEGTINNPSVSVTIHSAVGNLSNTTVDFTSCETSRDPGITAPSGQIVKWYTSGNSPINGIPNFDALGVGTHTYKVKASNNHPIRECISPSFATVTINVDEPTPTVYGTDQYCLSGIPGSDKLYVRDVDAHCSWQLRANNGSTVLDNDLAWDNTVDMYYFTFTPRTTVGSKTVRAYKNGVEFASFTQTIVDNQTASAAITFGGDFGYDAGNNKIHYCGDATVTLTKNTIGLNVSQWYWKKNGVKITGTDNDNTYTPTSDGVYELHLQTWSHDVSNCYVGSISNPSVEVNKMSVSNLESVSTTFNECQSSRTVTIDQLSNGNSIPTSYTVQWYNNAGTPLSSEPNWNSLGVGTHNYKVKGKISNTYRTCYSPSFGSVTVTIDDLYVNITSPTDNATVATGSTISINKTESNPYGTISYSLEGAGTSTAIANPTSFMIPADAIWGDDYRIQASTCDGNFYSPTFNVADYNRGSLILPLAGTTAFRAPTEVKWIRRPGDSYKFIYESVKTGERVETILNSNELTTESVTYSYNWDIPQDLEKGDYLLEVQEVNGAYTYTGDISIKNDLNVLSPDGGISYEIGRDLIITWTGGAVNNELVTIDLYKGGSLFQNITQIAGVSEFKWLVPTSVTVGNDYRIKISQTLNGVNRIDQSESDFSLILCSAPSVATASQNQNYVKEYTAREPDGACLARINDKNKVVESIGYIDGLGRPLQKVMRNNSQEIGGVSYDLVSMIEYDEFGRNSKSHLPFLSNTNNGQYLDMNNPANVLIKETFHESLYPGQSSYAFAERLLEKSPLDRPLKQGAPGDEWQISGTHTVDITYGTNAFQEVRLFKLNGNSINYSFYQQNELEKIVTKDENVGEQEGEVIEFKDKAGRTILKKVKLKEESGVKLYAETYYIYDYLNNLRFVIQPEGVRLIEDTNTPELTWSSINVESFRRTWMFSYEYDHRRRVVRKRVPGSDWVEMVYDGRDRLVLTRDGNRDLSDLNLGVQELSGNEGYTNPFYESHGTGIIKLTEGFNFLASGSNSFEAKASPIPEDRGWIYTKYDQFNRPVITGLLEEHGTRDEMVLALDLFYDGSGSYFEELDNSSETGYSNQSYPNNAGFEDALTINYYDGVGYEGNIPASSLIKVNGKLSKSSVKVLGTNDWLSSITFYDSRYRVIEVDTENYLGGNDVTKTNYRNAISTLPSDISTEHSGGEAVEIKESYVYDHMGRIVNIDHSVNGAIPTTISNQSYNGIDELVEKNLGGNSSPVQSLDYTYNIRGWLTHINNGQSLDTGESDQFGMELLYDKAVAGFEQYNGNIGEVKWKTPGAPISNNQLYRYEYDAAKRLLRANYGGGAIWNHFNTEGVTYDHNGNIMSLTRRQSLDGVLRTTDALIYEYFGDGHSASNQLMVVRDNGDDLTYSSSDPEIQKVRDLGFLDGNTSGNDYAYDDNGNLRQDLNKKIVDIKYNYLNLPYVVTFQNGDEVKYFYDANGDKLRKTANINNSITTIDYVAGIHFVNNTLSFLQHREGRVVKSGNAFTYEYHLLDHLGNVRVSIDESESVMQTDDFYPFGLSFNHWNQSTQGNGENLYKYNGKEEQKEIGLYDYGSRMYDAEIGRWSAVDPLSDSFYPASPYNYVLNNPVILTDPDGESPCPWYLNCFNPLGDNMERIRANRASNLGAGKVRSDGTQHHDGHDLYAPEGTQVYSVINGEVIKVHDEDSGDYGKHITIKHTVNITEDDVVIERKTYYSFYAHLSDVSVEVGDFVWAGDKIGKTGTTGNASPGTDGIDAHLHFEFGTQLRTGNYISRTGILDPNEAYADVSFESQNPGVTNQSDVGIIKWNYDGDGNVTSFIFQNFGTIHRLGPDIGREADSYDTFIDFVLYQR